MLRLANNKRLMGTHMNNAFVNVLAWGITIVLTVLTAALVVTTLFPV